MIIALLGMSIPNFWLGIILILIFSLYIPILPPSGYASPLLVAPWDAVRHLILPSMTLGTGMAAIVARMTRSEMLEEIGKEYVRTARAKGMSERRVDLSHTLKNALISDNNSHRSAVRQVAGRFRYRRIHFWLAGHRQPDGQLNLQPRLSINTDSDFIFCRGFYRG